MNHTQQRRFRRATGTPLFFASWGGTVTIKNAKASSPGVTSKYPSVRSKYRVVCDQNALPAKSKLGTASVSIVSATQWAIVLRFDRYLTGWFFNFFLLSWSFHRSSVLLCRFD